MTLMDDPAGRVAGVATQEDCAAFAASVARAEELLADRERRLDARRKLPFPRRAAAIALMVESTTGRRGIGERGRAGGKRRLGGQGLASRDDPPISAGDP